MPARPELFAGIGANWNATPNVAIRVEYQKFFDVGDDSKSVRAGHRRDQRRRAFQISKR